MSDAEKIEMLAAALEAIRQATFKPYQPPDPRSYLPTPMDVKIEAWARIQSIAARALRDVEETN